MELLIGTEALAAHLHDPAWIVFDVRHDLLDLNKGRRQYGEGHIPGAQFVDLHEDLSGPMDGRNGRHPLPDRTQFATAMAARGVGPGRNVVVYDEAVGMYATRLWWMLRWLGFDAVMLLDGGYAKWSAEGREVTIEVPQPRPVAPQFTPRDGLTVDADFIRQHLDDPAFQLVDARAGERFRGEVEPMDPVAGHIPGAVNRLFKLNHRTDGTFRPPAELRAEFERIAAGRDPAQVLHQCGSGVTACNNLFAMELAGLHGSRLYPGSWSEWVSDPSRPVATGA